jgi:hypothetical protein
MTACRNIDSTAHTFADGTDRYIVCHDFADMAILAVTSSDLVRRRNGKSPDRGRRSVGNRPLEGSFSFGCLLLINMSDL